jgi:two-component system sensor histidine kinase/response regulator
MAKLPESAADRMIASGDEGKITQRRRAAPGRSRAALEILVAEDNEFNAQLLDQLLHRRGHHAHIAASGDEALVMIESRDFDLVILDLRLPGRDGFEIMECIRDREQATRRHVPVIALTARARKEDRVRCLAAGMDEFLTKPIDASALWAAIERLAPSNGGDSSGRHGRRWLDARVLLAGCGGDRVILERIGRALRAHVPAELASAEASWRARDAVALREAAHRLYGMVAAASSSVGRVASDLESEAAAGRLCEAGILLERLRQVTEALLSEMDDVSLEDLHRLLAAPTIGSRGQRVRD